MTNQEVTPPVAVPLDWPVNCNEVPKEVFFRKDIYERELVRIFQGPEWHPIAHESEVPHPGDFKTISLAGVPLLVSRGTDNVVRVFYNSCAHRANQVETAPLGNRKEFECPYHRWIYDTDGQLIGCPNQREFLPGFDRKDYPLKQPRTEAYLGLVCVTFSDLTEPLSRYLSGLEPTMDALLVSDGRLKLLGYQKVRYDTNWKAYMDNDGYHAPLLHQAFSMLNWQGGSGRQYTATKRGHLGFDSSLSVAKDNGVLKDHSILEKRGKDAGGGSHIVNLFPTFVGTKHLDAINLRFAFPISADQVEVHYAYFAHADDDEAMVSHRIHQSSNLLGPCGLVSMEDASIFHRVHIGSHTPGNAIFQKGVKEQGTIPQTMLQNDETGHLQRWEYYRDIMGFERSAK